MREPRAPAAAGLEGKDGFYEGIRTGIKQLAIAERIDEEVRAVREVLGSTTTLAGFYSYGEISPFMAGAPCELHNQTMTITTLSEQ